MAARAAKLSRGATLDAVDHALQRVDQATESELQAAGVVGLSQVLERDTPAQWVGSAAAAHGLEGEADRDRLRQVLGDGVLPSGQSMRGRAVEVTTYGAVVTMPKTVSMLLAGDAAQRAAATAAQDAAVAAYLRTLEDLLRTRTRAAGVNSVAAGGLVAARFDHASSSTGDPHLHTHLLIAATTPGPDGKWRSLDGKTFFAAKRVAEAAAMHAAQQSLEQSLQIGASAWEWKQVGSVRTPEIACLSHLIEPLSGARRHVADTLTDMGRTLGAASWAEDLTAWRRHRVERGALGEKIEHAVDAALYEGGEQAEAVRALWRERAPDLAPALEAVAWGFDLEERERPAEQVAREALSFIEQHHTWTHADLAAWLVPDSQGDHRAAYREAARLMDGWAEAGLITTPGPIQPVVEAVLMRQEIETKAVHSRVGLHAACVSQAELIAERQLHDVAHELAERQGVRLAVAVEEKWSAEQVAAVTQIAGGRGLVSVTGVAGAGKTTIAAPCAEAAHKRGMQVISIARNAARALDTGEGINADASMSVAAFLNRDIEKIGKNRPVLLVVDEAAVIDREDWKQILEKAEKGRVQIVAFGDRKQAQSIDRTGGFSLVNAAAEKAGTASLLTKSYRNQAWEKEADWLRHGASDKVVQAATETGRIQAVAEDDFARRIAERIAAQPGTVAITQTNADAAAISRSVQAALGIQTTTQIAQDSWAGPGDRIRTRLNDWNSKILNGDRWTVVAATTGGGLLVENEQGRAVNLPGEYVRKAVELDYAATLDSAQGITVPLALPLVRPGMGRSQLYSAGTRGKAAPEYYVLAEDSKQAAGVLAGSISTDDLARTAGEIKTQIEAERLTALEAEKKKQLEAHENRKKLENSWESFGESSLRLNAMMTQIEASMQRTEQALGGFEAQQQQAADVARRAEQARWADMASRWQKYQQQPEQQQEPEQKRSRSHGHGPSL